MAYDSLGDFLNVLQDDGELVRVGVLVDPVLEIAEIVDRLCKSPGGGPCVLFERVRGSTMPVVANVLGSHQRMCRALGVTSFDEVADRLAELITPQLPESWLDKIKAVPQFAQWSKLPPKIVRTGACQQVVQLGRDVDLSELPVLQCWPGDAGRLITGGQVFTKSPVTGERNVGAYRLQVRGKNVCSLHWHLQHDGYQHFREYQKLGQQMPVAVSLGGDPLYSYLATVPLPPNTDECLFGGFLRQENIELVKCRSIEMEVPASAEIVLEGFIDPSEPCETVGPHGDHTGFYSSAEQFPLLHVTALTQRANPIYPTLVLGKPPMEDYWMGKATERIFLPLLKRIIPELVDYHFPRAGVFRNMCFVSMHKTYPQQARKVLNAIWSLGPLMFSKIVVLVDAHVDVHNEEQVWFQVGANVHPGRDVVFNEGPTSMLDHAAPVSGVGHKMGFDATRKLSAEGHPRNWPDELQMSPEVKDLVSTRWAEYGFAPPAGELR